MRPARIPIRPSRLGLVHALLLVLGLAGLGHATEPGPTVAQLLSVCDRALAAGSAGPDAAACEWFAAPCACKPRGRDGGALPWCVPDSESIDAVVRQVVTALRLAPSADAPADAAVRDILERLYPCP